MLRAPQPGEDMLAAARRRLAYELGITAPISLVLSLPDFRYRAQWEGIWENEVCPVLVGSHEGPVRPNSEEVVAVRWIDWESFASTCGTELVSGCTDFNEFSPWSRWEAAQLMTRDPVLCGTEWLPPAPAS